MAKTISTNNMKTKIASEVQKKGETTWSDAPAKSAGQKILQAKSGHAPSAIDHVEEVPAYDQDYRHWGIND